MRQSEVFPYYRKCCTAIEEIYNIIKDYYEGDFVEELMTLRAYVSEEQRREIERRNLGRCSIIPEVLGGMADGLGFITKGQSFLLDNRYIIPVYDVSGRLCTLVGYYPDVRKYVTVPTPFFSKEVMFFNFKEAYELSYKKYDGCVILVEGMFDCISLSALGLPAIATMGGNVGSIKGELLKVFKKVVGVPDNDSTGRRSLNRYSRYGWKVPSSATLVRLSGEYDFGSETRKIKDCDDIVSWFDADDVVYMFKDLFKLKEDIYDLKL